MNYGLAFKTSIEEANRVPRHSAGVRIAHWIVVLSVLGLLCSGLAILLAHPRLYWGEAGALGAPSLVDLPLPLVIGPSVWNRPIHFLFAWILVLTGLTYVVAGFKTRHFSRDLLPAKAELTWSNIKGTVCDYMRWKQTRANGAATYNVLQRMTYLAVIFVVFPAIVWTGLAMSPTLMSAFPMIVTVLGGHQSARTLHFVFVSLLMIFLIVHIAMVCLAGFGNRMRAMTTGHSVARKERHEPPALPASAD